MKENRRLSKFAQTFSALAIGASLSFLPPQQQAQDLSCVNPMQYDTTRIFLGDEFLGFGTCKKTGKIKNLSGQEFNVSWYGDLNSSTKKNDMIVLKDKSGDLLQGKATYFFQTDESVSFSLLGDARNQTFLIDPSTLWKISEEKKVDVGKNVYVESFVEHKTSDGRISVFVKGETKIYVRGEIGEVSMQVNPDTFVNALLEMGKEDGKLGEVKAWLEDNSLYINLTYFNSIFAGEFTFADPKNNQPAIINYPQSLVDSYIQAKDELRKTKKNYLLAGPESVIYHELYHQYQFIVNPEIFASHEELLLLFGAGIVALAGLRFGVGLRGAAIIGLAGLLIAGVASVTEVFRFSEQQAGEKTGMIMNDPAFTHQFEGNFFTYTK